LAAAVVVGASVLLTPAASADESNGLEVELVPGQFISARNGVWTGVSIRTYRFHINVTDVGELDDDGLHLFVSVPFSVRGYEGDRWDCWDVDGGAECEIADVVVPGETWPTLTILGSGTHIDDTIDVYATSTQGDAHAGVPFQVV
jgi:hypothetical protein